MKLVEFDCEGCGEHIIAFGMTEIPWNRFCSVCEFLDRDVAPDEIMPVLRRLRGGDLRRPDCCKTHKATEPEEPNRMSTPQRHAPE